VAAQTASGALRALQVGTGDVLVISGASGSVGSLATQLAILRGATVIGIAGASNADYLRRLRAIPVSYDGDVTAQIRDAAPDPVTKFLDCYGGDYVKLALALGVPANNVGTLVPSPIVFLKGVQFTGSRHAQPGDLDHVASLVADGTIQVTISQVLPFDLEAVRTGYADLLTGHVRGKLIVDIA
jgi:NADPH:quinone reductase-like Zn-dependent oxidoreductase